MVTETQQASKWERALVRAQANGVQVRFVGLTRDGYDVTARYEATSTSRPGTIHRVATHCTIEGVQVVCGCEAGQRGQVCQHAAGVLKAAGLFVGTEPATIPQPEPVAAAPQPIRSNGAAALARLQAASEDDPYGTAAD